MSSEEVQRWKEKYFQSIESQEVLQRRWDARLDLLRRGLVRSTLAAEGSDPIVDQRMKDMRDAIRSEDMDVELATLLPRLEKAVLDSEQRRETRTKQIGSALHALIKQLQALPLQREVRRPLKRLATQLDDRLAQTREIPLLLDELSSLQGRALAYAESPRKPQAGLLQRLFGGNEAPSVKSPVEGVETLAAVQSAESLAPVSVVIPALCEPTEAVDPALIERMTGACDRLPTRIPDAVEEPEAIPSVPGAGVDADKSSGRSQGNAESLLAMSDSAVNWESRIASEHTPTPTGPDLPLLEPDPLYGLPQSPEPSYSSVAAHIEATLLGLIDDLSLPEHHQPQADAICERLRGGLNWYELLPILDDLAVFVLAITDGGQHEFEVYLKQLNERLESFQDTLQAASNGHEQDRLAATQLHSQLREHVDGLQVSVQDATDLAGLKHILEHRLEGLVDSIDRHQRSRELLEQETALRLQGLAERVATMEQDAQEYRDHLEEQRQKALIDPLTGLPNRAAWSERLVGELARRQECGTPLAVAMLDLDHFKRINDSYGHLAGDKVLKIIAGELRKRLRPNDFIARFGGEEFVLLIPDTSPGIALELAGTLGRAINACPFHFKGEPVTVTVSIGVAEVTAGESGVQQALKRADQALYRAKEGGRNRVEFG